jgi:nicotinamidase-related amidase
MTEITNLRVLLIVDVQKCFLDGNLGIQGEKEVLEGGYSREDYLKVDINSDNYKLIKDLLSQKIISLNQGYQQIHKHLSVLNTKGLPSKTQLQLILGRIRIENENSESIDLSVENSSSQTSDSQSLLESNDQSSQTSDSQSLLESNDQSSQTYDSQSLLESNEQSSQTVDASVSLTSLEEDSVLFNKHINNVKKFCSESENLSKQKLTPAKTAKFYSLYIDRLKKFYEANKDKYDVIVFTKDNHPKHHASHGTLNPHCINRFGDYCGSKEREEDISKKFSNSFFYKNVLPDFVKDGMTSEEFYIKQIENDTGVKYQKYEKNEETLKSRKDNEENEGKTLGDFEEIPYNAKIFISDEGLELSSNVTDLKALSVGRFSKVEVDKDNKIGTLKPYIVRLNKGELCNFDSFGAFYYHVEYQHETGNEIDYFLQGPRDDLNLNKLSTGLAEFLLDRKSYDDNLKDRNFTFDFDVCGLVTNICVVSSCVSGSNILDQYLSKPHRSDVKLLDYRFNILNEYCVNLTLPHRNAQKIINTNKLGNIISITEGLDIQGYNPVTYN